MSDETPTHDHEHEPEAPAWRVEHSERIHTSRWFDVVRDRVEFGAGETREYVYVDNPGAVVVVPELEDGRIALIRSYRHATQSWSLETPAGSLGDQPGLDVEEVARRELVEELGATCKELVLLGRFQIANGFARYSPHFLLARGVSIDKEPTPETGEVLGARVIVPRDEAHRLAISGQINDGESAFAILLAHQWLRTHR